MEPADNVDSDHEVIEWVIAYEIEYRPGPTTYGAPREIMAIS